MGAPHFYMNNTDVGGAVYVYINKAGQWDTVTPIRLNGAKDSMFGLAVENIGDVNQDSFNGNLYAFVISFMLSDDFLPIRTSYLP